MNRLMKGASVLCLVAIAAVAGVKAADAQDPLSVARDLYVAAAYEEALGVLDRLGARDVGADERLAVEQYRAFCLLALGRTAEAERVIESIVAREPAYQPSDVDVSPRVRAVFTEVRRRMLPAIVQQKYVQARAAFDRRDFVTAVEGFNRVVEWLAEPDLAAVAKRPPLSDLNLLATGFRDLSAVAAAPPPPLPSQLIAAPTTSAPANIPAPPVYSAADPNVVPPVMVRQSLPPFPAYALPLGQGVVQIVVDEAGAVETATMVESVSAEYDRLIVSAARSWQYKPATLNGAPVKYRKNIGIKFGG